VASEKMANGMGEAASGTKYGCVEREAPERDEPWTWLWGEINPRRQGAEQTVERPRKPEDGT
jgi:hypothetical protein